MRDTSNKVYILRYEYKKIINKTEINKFQAIFIMYLKKFKLIFNVAHNFTKCEWLDNSCILIYVIFSQKQNVNLDIIKYK